MRRCATVLMLAAFCSALIACGPPFELPQPSGKFSVGTFAYQVTSATHLEPRFGDANDPRIFVVHFYYPASLVTGLKPMVYFPTFKTLANNAGLFVNTAVEKYTQDPWVTALSFVQVLLGTQVYASAPVAPGTFPLIVLSHGLEGSHCFHLATIQELVSQGYVVAAIEHSFSNTVTQLKDGRIFAPVRLAYQVEVDIRTGDVGDTLETIKSQSVPLFAQIDLSRTGILGHSLGGGTALNAASVFATEIDAVATLDGIDFGNGVTELMQPIQFLFSDDPEYPQFRCGQVRSFLAKPDTTCHEYVGLKHNGFLDFSVMRDFLSFDWYRELIANDIGPTGSTQFIVDLNQKLLEFFNRTLR
jgi:dienelactone hydrolase